MIALSADCLLFELASGESLPMSADMISVELMGDSGGPFDQEFVSHAANAVLVVRVLVKRMKRGRRHRLDAGDRQARVSNRHD